MLTRTFTFLLIHLPGKIILGICLCFKSLWQVSCFHTLKHYSKSGVRAYLFFQVRVYSGVPGWKTHHTGRQRGQIQQLLVLLKGEKLQWERSG